MGKKCMSKCVCPKDKDGKPMVFGPDKKCVPLDKCPKKPEPTKKPKEVEYELEEENDKPKKCQKGLVLDKCPRLACLDCGRYNKGCLKPEKPKKCFEKCVCPKDKDGKPMVFGKDKKYVPVEKCQKPGPKPGPKPQPKKCPEGTHYEPCARKECMTCNYGDDCKKDFKPKKCFGMCV